MPAPANSIFFKATSESCLFYKHISPFRETCCTKLETASQREAQSRRSIWGLYTEVLKETSLIWFGSGTWYLLLLPFCMHGNLLALKCLFSNVARHFLQVQQSYLFWNNSSFIELNLRAKAHLRKIVYIFHCHLLRYRMVVNKQLMRPGISHKISCVCFEINVWERSSCAGKGTIEAWN